jgi:hypothetical protein
MKHIGYHYPYHMLPAESADLPVVGMVRNPWDCYISWYAFNTRPEDKRAPPAAAPKEAAATAIPRYQGRVVGRNEPCPCNSGKKFKQCHGAPK